MHIRSEIFHYRHKFCYVLISAMTFLEHLWLHRNSSISVFTRSEDRHTPLHDRILRSKSVMNRETTRYNRHTILINRDSIFLTRCIPDIKTSLIASQIAKGFDVYFKSVIKTRSIRYNKQDIWDTIFITPLYSQSVRFHNDLSAADNNGFSSEASRHWLGYTV